METTGFMINNETRYLEVNSHSVETTFKVTHTSPDLEERLQTKGDSSKFNLLEDAV